MSHTCRSENSLKLSQYNSGYGKSLLYNHNFTIKMKQICKSSISILFSHRGKSYQGKRFVLPLASYGSDPDHLIKYFIVSLFMNSSRKTTRLFPRKGEPDMAERGVANGKCDNWGEDETSVFLCETEIESPKWLCKKLRGCETCEINLTKILRDLYFLRDHSPPLVRGKQSLFFTAKPNKTLKIVPSSL